MVENSERVRETAQQEVTPWFLTCLLLLVLIGTSFRFTQLNATFFPDEVWLAEFVSSRHYEPHGIPSPPLFFYLVKWLKSAFTGSIHGEALFRVAPFVNGILLVSAPMCFYPLIQGRIDRVSALVWTYLMSFSSPLMFYSSRLKQYTLEAFSAAVLTCLFIYVAQDMLDVRRWRLFLLTSCVFVLSLHSPVFILVSVFAGFSVLISTMGGGATGTQRRAARHLILTYMWISLAFVIAYYGYLKPGTRVTEYFGDLQQYFAQPGQQYWFDGSFGFFFWMSKLWVGQMFNLVRFFLALACMAIACSLVFGPNRRFTCALALVCGLPPLLVLAASGFQLYPYGEVRLMIFAAPGLYLIVAHACSRFLSSGHVLIRYASRIVCVAVAVAFTVNGVSHVYNASYMKTADMRPVYGVLAERHRSGEKVFIEGFDAHALIYYLPLLKKDVVVVDDRNLQLRVGGSSTGRLWVLEKRARPFFKVGGSTAYKVREEFQYEGYVLILFEREA